jgi:hypothetical protein
MTQQQAFQVLPVGLIKGGEASYMADLDTGNIQYYANVVAGALFFSKTYNYSGSYKVNPNLFLSSQLSEVGSVVVIGNLQFTVVKVVGNTAMVSIQVIGQSMNGTAICDLSQKTFSICSFDADAKIGIFDITLKLSPQ